MPHPGPAAEVDLWVDAHVAGRAVDCCLHRAGNAGGGGGNGHRGEGQCGDRRGTHQVFDHALHRLDTEGPHGMLRHGLLDWRPVRRLTAWHRMGSPERALPAGGRASRGPCRPRASAGDMVFKKICPSAKLRSASSSRPTIWSMASGHAALSLSGASTRNVDCHMIRCPQTVRQVGDGATPEATTGAYRVPDRSFAAVYGFMEGVVRGVCNAPAHAHDQPETGVRHLHG
jgi:hypothetical protein